MVSKAAQEESTYQRLLDSGYTDEQIQQIMSLGALDLQQKQLEDQKAQANALRKSAWVSPEGKMVSGIYVRPHLLEYLANVGKFWLGNRQVGQANSSEQELAKQQMQRRLQYLRTTPPIQPISPVSLTTGSEGFVP